VATLAGGANFDHKAGGQPPGGRMITDEQINDFCTTFLTSSPIERGKIIGEVIERADEPEYEHFAAGVIYLLRLKHRLDDAEAIVGPLISCGKYEVKHFGS
jgi:hypothetical protein